jgi:hypothetical protein
VILSDAENFSYVGYEVFTAVTMKNGVLWDVTPCGCCENRRFVLRRVRQLLLTASVVPISPILVTLMKEKPSSSETSVLTRATRRNIPEDVILQLLVCNVTRPSVYGSKMLGCAKL